LEDILEEVFGEINDEYDEIDTNYSVLDKNNFVFEGKISLVDFIRITNLNLNYFESSNTENDTLGGFITEIYGKIPTKNAQIKYEQLTFIVESSNQRKINRVKVIISDEEV